MILQNKKIIFFIICAIWIILSRIIPHAPNFTPVLAFALFAGSTLNNKYGIALSIGTFFISDLCLQVIYGYGFHNTMIYVYSSLLLIAFMGKFLLNKLTGANIFKMSVFSSCLFFVISNLGVYLQSFKYWNLEGLLSCYILAIPFFINTFISTIVYSFVFFKSYSFIMQENTSFKFKKLWN